MPTLKSRNRISTNSNLTDMLRIVKVINERHSLGLKVSIAVNSLKHAASLRSFENALRNELVSIRTGNHTKADVQYRMRFENEWTKDEKLIIYHEHATKGQQIIYIITES